MSYRLAYERFSLRRAWQGDAWSALSSIARFPRSHWPIYLLSRTETHTARTSPASRCGLPVGSNISLLVPLTRVTTARPAMRRSPRPPARAPSLAEPWLKWACVAPLLVFILLRPEMVHPSFCISCAEVGSHLIWHRASACIRAALAAPWSGEALARPLDFRVRLCGQPTLTPGRR